MLQPLSYWGTGYELGCIRDSYVILVLFTARVSDSVYIILSCYTLFGLLQMQWDLQATILHLFPRSFPCQEPINTWLHIGSCKCLSPNSSHLMFHPPSSITTPRPSGAWLLSPVRYFTTTFLSVHKCCETEGGDLMPCLSCHSTGICSLSFPFLFHCNCLFAST